MQSNENMGWCSDHWTGHLQHCRVSNSTKPTTKPDEILLNTSTSPNCNMTNFSCGDTTCIPWPWICDQDPECIDGSDESKDLCYASGKCGGSFSATNGHITSPSYPDKYPDESVCIYRISQPNGTVIKLNLRSMDIGDCRGDYLEIRDGSSEGSQLVGKYCGTSVPESIQSTTSSLWMR